MSSRQFRKKAPVGGSRQRYRVPGWGSKWGTAIYLKIRRPMRNVGLSKGFQKYELLIFKLISQLFCNRTAFKTKIGPFGKVPHRCVSVALAILHDPTSNCKHICGGNFWVRLDLPNSVPGDACSPGILPQTLSLCAAKVCSPWHNPAWNAGSVHSRVTLHACGAGYSE